MRAVCLFAVLVLAKVLVIAGADVPPAGWASAAYFWQDALVALLAGVLDLMFRRPRVGWALYAALVVYVALGVPVAIVLGTPMTWALIQAARGPLADSIAHYVTAAHLTRIAAVVVVGAVLPFVLARVGANRSAPVPGRWRAVAAGLVATVVIAGRMSASQIETRGMDRNAMTALVPIALPDIGTPSVAADWRLSPFNGPTSDAASTLSRFSGSAKGFNVLIVILESTAAQYLRPYGGVSSARDDPMPTVTALSDRAILFEHAYVTYPESIKGLFSTFCSRYPAFGVSADAHAAMPCAPVAAQLSAAGYRTALFHSGRFDYLGMDAVVARLGFGLAEDAGAIGGAVHSSFGVDEPATVDRLLRWIDIDAAPDAKPFFATYMPIAGHHPYATPTAGPFPEDSELNRYRNALHYGDQALSALLAGLRARGLDRDTMLMVFGDHGEAFGQHPGNIGHTLFINEENVRVPYLIAIPGMTTGPTRVGAVVSLIDTAPTLLDLLDLPVPATYQGTSLFRPGPRMALMFTDYSLGLLGLRDGCLKYVFEINAGRSTLFDVCRDPRETVDRAGFQADRVTAYRDRLAQWGAAQRAFANSSPPGQAR